MKFKSEKVELRGISNMQSKNGNVYYMVNVETMDGTSYSLYASESTGFQEGLSKGAHVYVTRELKMYKGNEQYDVVKVEKA